MLAQPFESRLLVGEYAPPSSQAQEWEFRSRVTKGSVVVRRATWWVSKRRLLERWFSNHGAMRLVDVACECRELSMPSTVFVRPYRSYKPAAHSSYKPIWVDTLNPLCLDILHSEVDGVEWMVFSEVLPDPCTNFSPFRNEKHVFELLAEVLV